MVLADDHESLLNALGRLLSLDCEVVARVATIAELMKAAQSLQPDIAIIDVTMPDANGLDACRELKQIQPGLEVIIITAMDSDGIRAAALKAGASEFVAKSEIHTRLLPAIHEIWRKTS